MLSKILSLFKIPWVRYTVLVVVVLIVLVLTYQQISAYIAKVQMEHAQAIVDAEDKVKAEMERQLKLKEGEWGRREATLESNIKALQLQREILQNRLRVSQQRVEQLERERIDVQNYVYKPGEVDSRFHDILVRGRRVR